MLRTWVPAILCALLCIGGDALAQQPTTATQSNVGASRSTPPQPTSSAQDSSDTKQQVKLLEAQLQMTREHQTALLTTVHWALAAVFVIAGLLLAFGWFANFKVYERDKLALRAELDAGLQKKTAELSQAIQEQLAKATASLPAMLSEGIAKSEQSLKARIGGVDSRLLALEVDIKKKAMNSNPSPNMALTDALGLLEIFQRVSIDDVPEVIKFMLNTIDKGGKLTAHEITRVNAVLDVLPPHYKALTERLPTKLIASDIF